MRNGKGENTIVPLRVKEELVMSIGFGLCLILPGTGINTTLN
jgi:hypothetical protein